MSLKGRDQLLKNPRGHAQQRPSVTTITLQNNSLLCQKQPPSFLCLFFFYKVWSMSLTLQVLPFKLSLLSVQQTKLELHHSPEVNCSDTHLHGACTWSMFPGTGTLGYNSAFSLGRCIPTKSLHSGALLGQRENDCILQGLLVCIWGGETVAIPYKADEVIKAISAPTHWVARDNTSTSSLTFKVGMMV